MSFEVKGEEIDRTLRGLLVQLMAMGTQNGVTLRVEGSESVWQACGRRQNGY